MNRAMIWNKVLQDRILLYQEGQVRQTERIFNLEKENGALMWRNQHLSLAVDMLMNEKQEHRSEEANYMELGLEQDTDTFYDAEDYVEEVTNIKIPEVEEQETAPKLYRREVFGTEDESNFERTSKNQSHNDKLGDAIMDMTENEGIEGKQLKRNTDCNNRKNKEQTHLTNLINTTLGTLQVEKIVEKVTSYVTLNLSTLEKLFETSSEKDILVDEQSHSFRGKMQDTTMTTASQKDSKGQVDGGKVSNVASHWWFSMAQVLVIMGVTLAQFGYIFGPNGSVINGIASQINTLIGTVKRTLGKQWQKLKETRRISKKKKQKVAEQHRRRNKYGTRWNTVSTVSTKHLIFIIVVAVGCFSSHIIHTQLAVPQTDTQERSTVRIKEENIEMWNLEEYECLQALAFESINEMTEANFSIEETTLKSKIYTSIDLITTYYSLKQMPKNELYLKETVENL